MFTLIYKVVCKQRLLKKNNGSKQEPHGFKVKSARLREEVGVTGIEPARPKDTRS